MAGRKQHHIPQCLLRGFEARRKGKHTQVYVFRAGQESYLSSTEGVAAERYFYSSLPTDKNKTLDDQITDYEQRLSSLLNQLRASCSSEPVDASVAAEVVTHLTVRGAYLRGIFDFCAREMRVGMSAFLSDAKSVRAWSGIDQNQPEKMLVEEIDRVIDGLKTQTPLPIPPDLLRRILLFRLREEFDTIYSQHRKQIPESLAQFEAAMIEAIRNGHTRVLNTTLVPEERAAALAGLYWRVIRAPQDDLILPDCVAISICEGNTPPYSSYVFNGHDTLERILLPLSSGLLLAGTANAGAEVHVDDFNPAAAACSLEFFVSSKATKQISNLASIIGSHTNETMLTTVRETVDAFHPKTRHSSEQGDTLLADTVNVTDFEEDGSMEALSYSVSFLDCADQQTAEEVAAVINCLVNEIGHVIPMRRLDSVIFAQDYVATLRNLDRGFVASAPLKPTEDELGISVAMAPIVVRNGEIRVCVVARSWLAHCLHQQDDEQAMLSSLHSIGIMLGRVAFVDIFDTALPGVLLQPIQDDLKSFLFQYIDDACTTYFSSRVMAGLFPAAAEAYGETFLAALQFLTSIVPEARLAYRTHGNLDVFLGIAQPAIGRVLVRAASLLGHYDGLARGGLTENQMITETLNQCGLHLWIEVFRHDLDVMFSRRHAWQSLDEFTNLSVHMERLLWQFGVIPWRTDEGGIRVEIPIGTDIDKLKF